MHVRLARGSSVVVTEQPASLQAAASTRSWSGVSAHAVMAPARRDGSAAAGAGAGHAGGSCAGGKGEACAATAVRTSGGVPERQAIVSES